MPNEINTLLASIESAQLKMLYGLEGVSSVERHAYVDIHQSAIDRAYERLIEICGEKADGYVVLSLQWVEVQYKIEQARLRIKKHIQHYLFEQAQTRKLYSYSY